IFNPQPHNRHMTIHPELDFAKHLFRAVRMLRKNQEQHFALLNRAGDLAGKRPPWPDITRRHPTSDPRLLQRRANRLGYLFVMGRMRNENVAGHREAKPARFYLPGAEQATEFNETRIKIPRSSANSV